MTSGQRRGRRAPIRRNGALVLAGLGLTVAGGYLQLSGHPREDGVPERPAAQCGTVRPATGKAAGGVTAAARAPVPKQVPAPRPGMPSQIAIARLGLVAPVVAINADQGSLTPPPDPRNAGWWSGGALPGARRGAAVITGHTVNNGGGAFDDLEQLRAGDTVVVSTSRGALTYRVVGVTTYRKQALARRAARVFDQSGAGRLVLITCEDWTGKVYLSNVVVIAQRVA